eukprot:4236010-Alexandrium_andersonii.AAC.1
MSSPARRCSAASTRCAWLWPRRQVDCLGRGATLGARSAPTRVCTRARGGRPRRSSTPPVVAFAAVGNPYGRPPSRCATRIGVRPGSSSSCEDRRPCGRQ